jgi:two-component system sensor histidine kinase KdpD
MADPVRGHLRIYLGAAPGVGKTYAMLGEGHRRAARGTDVVVGYVEDHARPNTAAMAVGLEVVPRRVVVHRDRPFEEMDLDAVLARRPKVALVDELAHTNVPGSRNEKRWQDVQELLDAGIDVISTVNVQHLESVNDVVERITGIVQRETVPDRVVRAADQVELVDMTAEALRRRMAHGNVYGPEKIEEALTNYFRVGNLTALRELALLWLAEKVDDSLVDYQDTHGIDRTWEARERVVVALTGAPSGEHLVRRAGRLAARARGDLLGVHVRSAAGLVEATPAGLERQRTLLADLGGAYHEVVGDDVAAALVHFARAEHATQIVLGATHRTRWNEVWRGSVVNRVVRASGDMDVHVISQGGEEPTRSSGRRPRLLPPPSPISVRRRLVGWLVGLLGIPLLTVVLVAARHRVGLPTDLMAFVLLVVVASAIGGAGPGLTTAVLTGLALNWYLTEPYHTLTIAEPENTLALVGFVLVGVIVSVLVARAERRAADARRSAHEAEALAGAAAGLALSDDPVPPLLDRIRTTFSLDGAALYAEGAAGWHLVQGSGDRLPDGPDGTDLQMSVGDTTVLGICGQVRSEDSMVLTAFAAQLATALEQRRLRTEAAAAEVAAEGDALRTALLRAVSHDLRTPLASIKASVSGLLADDVHFSDEDRREFHLTIDEETDRLDHLVGNLLDMSRLETGVVRLDRRSVGWEEIVAAALATVPNPDDHPIHVAVDETLPEIEADPALLERAVANVVANALRHGGPRAVEIGARQLADHVELVIADHGPGVPVEDREKIFEPFQRLGDQGGAGVGLGLAVAHGFVAAMGGAISTEDTPGGGLTLRIAMPTADRAGSPS